MANSDEKSDSPPPEAASAELPVCGAYAASSPLGPELNGDEILQRLTLVSPPLVEQLYSIALKQVEDSRARLTRLEGKANTLIAAAGLSVAVASAANAMLAGRKAPLDLPDFLIGALILAALLGLASVLTAVITLRVEYEQTVNSRAVFSDEMLARAEDPPGADDLTESRDKQAFGLALYRQYLIAHLWEIYRANTRRTDSKAKWVLWGQRLFVAFLVVLLASEVWLGFVLANQSSPPPECAATEGTATMPQKPPPPPPPPPPRDVRGNYAPPARRVPPTAPSVPSTPPKAPPAPAKPAPTIKKP